MFKESIAMSIKNITQNKMRSFLTILGIIIGITAVITLVTLIQGVSNEVTEQFSDLGTGKVTIYVTGTSSVQGLREEDMDRIQENHNISGIAPAVDSEADIQRGKRLVKGVDVQGRGETYFLKNAGIVVRGRPLNAIDVQNRNRVCLINKRMEEELFYGEDALLQEIRIRGQTFTVIGIIDESEVLDLSKEMSPKETADECVIIPYRTAQLLFSKDSVQVMDVYIKNTDEIEGTLTQLRSVLDEAFNEKEESYALIDMNSLLESFQMITSLMKTLMGGIASIALLVGGIGIMNMMLVSVTERTREIGLRKALGAEPIRIQGQFLMESVILSLLGGVLGLLVGIGLSYILCALIDIGCQISLSSVGLAVGFSALIGVIFGWAPARRASVLNPIDALRTE